MEGDTSDILGNPVLSNVRDTRSGAWSGLSLGIKATFGSAILLVLYAASMWAWESFLIWREKSYRLSMRRRHGIPDNDHRPFNVAYAAVMLARQESEAAIRRAKLEQMLPVQDQRVALPDQDIRQRPASQQSVTTRPNTIPGGFRLSADGTSASASNLKHSYSSSINFQDRYNPNPVVRLAHSKNDISAFKAGPSRRVSRRNIDIIGEEARKGGSDNDGFHGSDHAQEMGQEFVDGDEDAEWQEELPQRGSKRVLGDGDDNEDAYQPKRTRDKRPRKVSLEKTPQYAPEEMDIDEDEDKVPELESTSRGRKRDRAEAGSTFGGDDEDSSREAEEEDDAKARQRHRKRRTYAKRKSDTGNVSRGKKRDRDGQEDESNSENDDSIALKVSRKKRGKKSVLLSEHEEEGKRGGSDVSMDESHASSVKGRRRPIGMEWESNGVKYKIGPNGQKLRQALVKKARQKFNMPQDSQHPDRQANLEVFVETWLTEEEFQDAKDRLLLAWQDSNKPSVEPETPSAEPQDSPSSRAPAGKDLLWKSTAAGPVSGHSTPRQVTPPGVSQYKQQDQDPYRQSIATNVGLRINPFEKRYATSGKRIASAARVSSTFTNTGTYPGSPISPSLADSTNGSPRGGYRMFSKWEKQDLEAKAMMKMREANRKKEEEKAQKLKEEQEKVEKEKAEKERKDREAAAAAAVKPIPTITLTKPDEAKPVQAEAKMPTFSFGPPSTTVEPSKAVDPQPPTSTDKPATPFGHTGETGQPKPVDNAFKQPLFPTQSQTSSATPTFQSTTSLTNAPTKPAGSVFGPSKPESPQFKLPNSFAFPAPSNPPSNPPAPSSTTPSQPTFSFGPSPFQPSQAAKPEEKKDDQVNQGTSSGGTSLLSRLAPQNNTSQPSSNRSPFSFSKPAGETSKPASVFSNLSTSSNATSQTAPTFTTTPSTAPKFSFGLPNKPATPNSSSASVPSSLSGALGSNDTKSTSNPSPFNFKVPSVPAESTGATNNGTTAPKFSFAPPSGSAFGSTTQGANNTSTLTSTAPSASSSNTPAAPAFTGFGANGASSTNSQTTSSSPFASNNIFGGGGTPNIFGSTTKLGEAPKATTFAFGTPPASTTPATTPSKPGFSFGNTAATTAVPTSAPPAGGTSAFSFNFGDASKNSTTPQASPATGQSLFGRPSGGPTAFGFGATGASSIFGKSPASAGQQQQ